jgi:hypothetical protein
MTNLPPEPEAPPALGNPDEPPPAINLSGGEDLSGLVGGEPTGTVDDNQLFGADSGVLDP